MFDSLEDRILKFLASQPDAESIDQIDYPHNPKFSRKADFLLLSRSVIVEIKTLKTETMQKIDREIDRHREREEFPIFYGRMELNKVIKNFPDKEKINSKIVNSISRSIEDAVRSAEEQIYHTRQNLQLPDAASVLIILNESIQALDPYTVNWRVSKLMRRERSGNVESEKLNFVLSVFESHSVDADGYLRPVILLRGPGAERFPWFEDFYDELMAKWGEYNKTQSMVGASETPSDLQTTFYQSKEIPPESGITRQELWCLHYRANPYLRNLKDEDVLAHGSKLIGQISPNFIKGAIKQELNEDLFKAKLEAFTHFLEEMNYRGLDIRKMPRPVVK